MLFQEFLEALVVDEVDRGFGDCEHEIGEAIPESDAYALPIAAIKFQRADLNHIINMRLLAWIWILPFLFQLATAHAARRWFGSDVIPLKVHDLDSRTTRLRFDYTYLKLCPAPISLTSLRK